MLLCLPSGAINLKINIEAQTNLFVLQVLADVISCRRNSRYIIHADYKPYLYSDIEKENK